MITFNDRVSDTPNRRKIKIVTNTPEEIIADIEYADSPIPNCEGTPLNAKTFNDLQTDMMRQVVEINNGVKLTYSATDWQDNADSINKAPYQITVPYARHALGAQAYVAYFNEGCDEFEWRKDEEGNITIYSNVKVAMTVNIK